MAYFSSTGRDNFAHDPNVSVSKEVCYLFSVVITNHQKSCYLSHSIPGPCEPGLKGRVAELNFSTQSLYPHRSPHLTSRSSLLQTCLVRLPTPRQINSVDSFYWPLEYVLKLNNKGQEQKKTVKYTEKREGPEHDETWTIRVFGKISHSKTILFNLHGI